MHMMAWLEVLLVVVYAMAWFPCCIAPHTCPIPCSHCTINGPATFEVVFDGFADDNCTGCTDVNGTYILSFFGILGSTCVWRKTISLASEWNSIRVNNGASCIVPSSARIDLQIDSGRIQVDALMIFGIGGTQNELHSFVDTTLGSPYDCCNLSGHSVPWNVEVNTATANESCDSAGAGTCTVTGI
jgi:hypothetical protein